MAEPFKIKLQFPPAFQGKVITIKIIALTVISLALGFAQGWASSRYYQPDYVAGFQRPAGGCAHARRVAGIVDGARSADLRAEQSGRGYKIGYILGLNICGTFFFGIGFWQPRRQDGI